MEPSTRTPAMTPAELARALAESGLISSAAVQAFTLTLPAEKRADARQVMQELVRQGKLTKYQAQRVWQGKGTNLVLGNYVVLDKLGAGGMGVVYKAQHRLMQRIVALKVLGAEVTRSPQALARFQREAVATARLSHANIVTAFDAQQAGGVHFMVMEYVEGKDLGQLVKGNGPLPVGLAAECVRQVADGLGHAHEHGIIHRDVKPGNLLLDQRGCVKVLDLGLARFDNTLSTPGADAGQLTHAAVVFGTTDFMSPEQGANSRNTDPRSDIYSLGCTFWYLATGTPLYAGETAIAKLIAHREEPIPSLRKAKPETPRALDNIFQRMVAKKPEDRYQSMAEVLTDLEPCVESLAGPPRERDSQLAALLGAPAGGSLANVSLAETQLGMERSTRTLRRLLPARPPRAWLIGGVLAVGALGLGVLTLLFALSSTDAKPTQAATAPPAPTKVTPAPTKATPRPTELATRREPPKPEAQVTDAWVASVAREPAEKQLDMVVARLKELNPGFNGPVEAHFDKGTVAELKFPTEFVTDVTPLRALPGLVKLECFMAQGSRGKLVDLRPIAALRQLTTLNISRNPIADLTPLKDLRLHRLEMRGMQPADLTPLKGMPLVELGMPPPLARRHAELLRSIPSLEKVNGLAVADAVK